MTKLDPKDFRNNHIRVFENGTEIASYSGKIYIYFGDKVNDGCLHFVDENSKHHRIYGGTVIVDEE